VRGGVAYVVDASVYLPLVTILGEGLVDVAKRWRMHVLDLTLYEVLNGLWKLHTRLRRIGLDEMRRTGRLAVELTRYMRVHKLAELDVDEVTSIAVESGITVYDASYIALARRLKLPVVSNDADILESAPRHGVQAYTLDRFLEAITPQGAGERP